MESVPTSGEDQHATTTVSKDADDLVSEIHSQNVECFNSTTSWKFAVTEGRDSPLLSLDSELDDGELLLTIQFNQIVHLRAVLVHGKSGEERISAPKRVKLFANKPNYQFDDCSTKKATQKLLFEEKECIFREGNAMELDQTLFKNVRTITLFVETNQSDAPQTKIGKIQFFGTPVHTTDMSAIKKC
mmetsp:Transcript_4656/g.15075  ORF Transcript_4656/g.15075 Transcript_4656/m.15075 type:complete len:187 (-) Transcript_4656:432-992(-)